MDKIAYFDYSATLIFGLLIVSVITRKMLKGKQNRDYLVLVVCAFLTTVFDVFAITFDKAGVGFTIEKYLFHTLYLLFHSATLPLYLLFLIRLTGSEHLTLKKPTFRILAPMPLEVEIFLLVLNLFTHNMFSFNEAGEYVRGNLFFANYVIAVFYAVYALVILIRFRKTISAMKFWSLFLLFPAILTAVVIQLFFPQILIEMFVISVCVLYVALVVIRPEENVDADTGFLSFPAYVDMVRRGELINRHSVFILINISNFRSLYRSLGYKAYSQLTLQVAYLITEVCGKQKVHAEYYYLGNGKFRIVADNDDRPLVPECAKAIQQGLSEGFLFRDVEISLLTNVCILHWPEDADTEKSIMLFDSQFEEMPYRAGVMYAKEIMGKKNFNIILSLDTILEEALKYRQFEVYYQPIYSVKEKRFTTAEALIRLNTKEFGFIPPDLFIPIAEQNGTIHRIGHYVLEEVCRFISEDRFPELEIRCIDVNLSTIQCLEKNLAKEISMILGAYNVQPTQINLEITETATSMEYADLINNIQNLSARGFHFSLDDYGTGYSNISRAMNMPLSVIKLDKSITQLEKDTKLYAIGAHTVRMIKDMNMDIVAEGIETEETLKKFEEMGCDYIQGYYFSKPLPKEEFVKFILKSLGKLPGEDEETGK